MKDEKLKLMLNKVVEYNNPKADDGKGENFKAFLYKNNRGYYFKVVEIITGTDIAFNDIIYLEDGDEKFLVIAEKPKLMRISKKSWHYRLLQYVLRSQAPTPHDMQNGCPYFWLVMFSLIVVPFVVLFKIVKEAILLIPKMLFWVLKQLVESWVAGLDDEAAYEFRTYGNYSSYTKMPKTAKIFFDNDNDNDFFSLFLSKKYKVDKNDPKYLEKQKEIEGKWKTWREDIEKRRAEQRELDIKRNDERYRKESIRETKRAEAKAKWDARMKPINDSFTDMGVWFRETFTVERGRRNMIVKRTKQFVGGVVTLVVLAATFFAVNYIALALMFAADWCITNWQIFLGAGIFGIIIGIFYLFYILITSWGEAVINKYRRGKKVWYIEPFIYIIWYPVKYIAMFIAFIVANIIWIPIKFIFYTILFKNFLKPIGLFIAKISVGLVKGIIGSTGIFGEYFGASYSDFCPGLEWVDFDEE